MVPATPATHEDATPDAADPGVWVAAVRRSHDRLTGLTEDLGPTGVAAPSACTGWSIAQVLSHLGSQAEIFSLFLDAALTGGDAPGPEAFGPIWDVWNGRSPEEQAAESRTANEAFVRRLEGLDEAQLASLHLSAFGRELDTVALLRMRLSEHALHTWDVAVALDPAATVPADAVALLVDGLAEVAGRAGRPVEPSRTLAVTTTAPERRFTLVLDGVRLEPGADQATDGTLHLPAEVLLRLVYGRLRPRDEESVALAAEGLTGDDLRAAFPGF